ncbi:MAG: glycosyltransferase [Gemmatimonadota bacterium]
MIYALLSSRDQADALELRLAQLAATAAALPERLRVVVVDDGSVDATSQVVHAFAGRLDVWLVRHVRPAGGAASLRTGLCLALEDSGSPDDVLLALPLHADAAAVAGIVAVLRKGSADVAVGSARPVPGPGLGRRVATLFGGLPISGKCAHVCARGFRMGVLPSLVASGADRELSASGDGEAAAELERRARARGARCVRVGAAGSATVRGRRPRTAWRWAPAAAAARLCR